MGIKISWIERKPDNPIKVFGVSLKFSNITLMKIYTLLLLLAVSFAACTPKVKPVAEKSTLNEEGGRTEELGEMTLSGTPYQTKGAQFMLQGVIVNDREVLEKHGLYHIGSEALGKYTVEITGKVNRYHCGPMEQCLSEGYIDNMPKISSITVR